MKDLDHATVVKIFRSRDSVSLVIFPAQFSEVSLSKVYESIQGKTKLKMLHVCTY